MEYIIREKILEALEVLRLPKVDFVIEHPKDLSHGDWATNVALVLSKKVGTSPSVIAGDIVNALNAHFIDGVESITLAGPGFINFILKRDVFIKELVCSEDEKWGSTDVYNGHKILVEHSSPNLFKPFHIGHLMNNTIGEAITRLAKSSGAQVTTMSFPSDISLGVAKAIFIILEKLEKDEGYKWDDIIVLGNAYVEGTKRYEEDESIHEHVKRIANDLYEINQFRSKDDPWVVLYEKCKHFNISYFEQVVKRLGSSFDEYIYESEAGVAGKCLVEMNTPNIFTESEGAVVYIPDEERKDINTAVFINSQGNPTYEAKDVGLLQMKFDRYAPDLSLFVTDSQQSSHFEIVLDAARKIKSEWAEKSRHITHGRMSFKGQKMSSRLGGVPLVEDILATVMEEVRQKSSDVSEEIAERIALGALKYTILKTKAGMNINFDPETSLSFEGDSGPYLQYTAVRAGALIEKGKEQGIVSSYKHSVSGTETLERILIRFPELVARAQQEWAPHYLVTYLTELAQYFNSWYGQEKIIDGDRKGSAYRLAIVSSVRNTLIKGLYLLGIETPERM